MPGGRPSRWVAQHKGCQKAVDTLKADLTTVIDERDAEIERLKRSLENMAAIAAVFRQQCRELESENARLRQTIHAFVEHHDNGQSGQPGHPKTYDEEDIWQTEWDGRYADLAAEVKVSE